MQFDLMDEQMFFFFFVLFCYLQTHYNLITLNFTVTLFLLVLIFVISFLFSGQTQHIHTQREK